MQNDHLSLVQSLGLVRAISEATAPNARESRY